MVQNLKIAESRVFILEAFHSISDEFCRKVSDEKFRE